MKKLIYLLISISLITNVLSCKKEKDDPDVVVGNHGVFIINEGNFQFGNAKVSYYDIDSTKVKEDLYEPVNGVPLGDIGQSMVLRNGKAYIVVNNSGKIEIVDAKTFKNIATISGFTSPRYIFPVSDTKAYVTDLFSDYISIVNLQTNTITGKVACNGWTEEMYMYAGELYITNEETDKLYVLNTITDKFIDSIQIGYGGNSIREDKNGTLWVMCSGNYVDIKASLFHIDPNTNTVINSFQFPDLSHSPYKLKINNTYDTLYYLDKSVFKMSVDDNTLPTKSFISAGTHQFYGLGIEPGTGIVYVSDAIDYIQRGRVYRYSSNGVEINSFLAGINPGDFIFQ